MSHQSIVIGKIIQIDESGAAIVDWDGNAHGPRVARSALGCRRASDESRASVVLAFESDDPKLPVILGFVHAELFSEVEKSEVEIGGEKPANLRLEARNSIELRCGESSVSMDRAGRIRVKGTHVVSRASGLHRIKGATVEIN